MKHRRPADNNKQSAKVGGVPNWVSRGASTGDIFASEKAKQRSADEKDSEGFLRLPPIARNPHLAVKEYVESHRAHSEKVRLNRKTKGIVEALPLEEKSLLPFVGGNRHDPALEGYAAAANEAARRHQSQRHRAEQERERKAQLQRTFSNKNMWKDSNTGTRTRTELTARNLHKAQMKEDEQKQQEQQLQLTPQANLLEDLVHNADVSVSPYSRGLRAPPLVSFVPAAGGDSPQQQQQPVFVIDGEEREEEEEQARRAHRQKLEHESSLTDEKEASLTSLPAMASGEDSSLRHHGSGSPSPAQLQLQQPSPTKKGNPRSAAVPLATIKICDSQTFGAAVEADNEDDDGDDGADRPHVSELTLTYLRMLEKNEGFERRNLERSFGEQLHNMAPQRDRLLNAVRALMRERRQVELEEEKLRASTVEPEYEAGFRQLVGEMLHDRGFAQFHEQQRPACPVLRPGRQISIDMRHSTTYVVEWRHRNTHPLELVAVLLDGENKVIGTASKTNTVRSREGITCVRPFSTASPSLVRLGPVTFRSCLQVSLVTLPPQTRSIVFSVVMPWQTLHQRENLLMAEALAPPQHHQVPSPFSPSSTLSRRGSMATVTGKDSPAGGGGGAAGRSKLRTAGGTETIVAEPLEYTTTTVDGGSAHQHLLALPDAKRAALFHGFGDIGAGWLTVFDALPLVQTVGAHLAPDEVPVLEEVTTVELAPAPGLANCVAVTLGAFHLDHRSRTPAVFQAMDRRYVGGKRTVESISAFSGLCNTAPTESQRNHNSNNSKKDKNSGTSIKSSNPAVPPKSPFESAMECLVAEMCAARAALLLPMMALYEAFGRQKMAIEERKGDPRIIMEAPSPPAGTAAAAAASPEDTTNSKTSAGTIPIMPSPERRSTQLAPAAQAMDWRSRPTTPTVGFVRSTPTPPPVLFEPRTVGEMGREELYEDVFHHGVHAITQKVLQENLTRTASSIL